MKLDPRHSVKACPHHTVSQAWSWRWCYDHFVGKLTLCYLGLYHMYISRCVLMYLYYIYLLISAMMDLLSDEIPPKFYERLRRWILSKVGDRFAYGMGCWMWHGEKKIGKMDPLALYQNNAMVSSGFTRSTYLLNCLMLELTKVHSIPIVFD